MIDRAAWDVGRSATEGGEFPNVWAGVPNRDLYLLFGLLVMAAAVDTLLRPFIWVLRRARGGS